MTHDERQEDIYITVCSELICDVFRHSQVFRIGGDEFVAILQGSDHDNRYALTERLKSRFFDSYSDEDKDPWNWYSAALGMAEYTQDDDSFDAVFKRAARIFFERLRAHGIARIVVGEVLRRLAHHVRRVHLERIAGVRVERRAPAALAVRAVRLPRTRHLDRFPAGDVIIQFLEADRTQRGLLHPLELPRRVGVEADLPIRLPREDF